MVKNKSSTMSLRDNAHLSGSAASFQPETASVSYAHRESQPASVYNDSRGVPAAFSRPAPLVSSPRDEEQHAVPQSFGGHPYHPTHQPPYYSSQAPPPGAYPMYGTGPPTAASLASMYPPGSHIQTFTTGPQSIAPIPSPPRFGSKMPAFTTGPQPIGNQTYTSGPSQCYIPAKLPTEMPPMQSTAAVTRIKKTITLNTPEDLANFGLSKAQFEADLVAHLRKEQNLDPSVDVQVKWPEVPSPISAEAQPGQSLFEKYNETLLKQQLKPMRSLITKAFGGENTLKSPEEYCKPFCDFMTENVTVFHAVDAFEKKLTKAGFKKLSERKTWNEEIVAGGKYYTTRNGSSLIAFSIGDTYKSGNGVAMIAGHIDALTARLKPVSSKKNSAGYLQLGVAPYAGALNTTWWDRDLGIAGRVLVKDSTGKIATKLVKLGWPIARIPTLAPHFGVGMLGTNNPETQAVPIIGLDNSDLNAMDDEFKNLTLGGIGSFAATQPPKLVKAIAGELSISDYSSIVNWELELFDTQPAQTGGLDKEFIFAGRIDDKICSWAAIEGLLASVATPTKDDGIVKLVGLFDDEEIGSQLRQGAKSNFLPSVIERITESFASGSSMSNTLFQTYANSFLVSADVSHAVNPNFLGSYLEGHMPRLNVGLAIAADSNGHMTTDSVSTALMARCAEKSDSKLQFFQIRNDSRSGGTVGPMLSSAMGVRSIDAGIPQLSMHSIRATVGNLDPGLGVKMFKGFLDHFEAVDREFE